MHNINEVIFALVALCVSVNHAMHSGEGSSHPTNTESTFVIYEVDFGELDQPVMQLLNSETTYDEFVRGVEELNTSRSSPTYNEFNIELLYNTFDAFRFFNQPCRADIMDKYQRAVVVAQKQKNQAVRKIINYMINKRTPTSYVLKCINEFDTIARQYYWDEADARELMKKLMLLIRPETKNKMKLSALEQDMNVSRIGILKKMAGDKSYLAVCNRTSITEDVQRAVSLMYRILGGSIFFHIEPIVDKLRRQISSEDPSSVKLLSLALYCKSLLEFTGR